ncbi:OB-fold nucleic acid binding domain-containing protein [Methanosphaera cuniculi]|uniref:OB-fold nucleic acid binding domain-containing protein n=1 Tax=Methanosphaera cuniculi TaxID=1077256 RepID=UPI0026EB7CAC|nr:OB-fold nucleic acid binding domain-containing protein [Methanosphaera cuniculi]
MQDQKIFKIATITTIIGIIGLILTSGMVMPNELKIKQIDNSHIDEQVQITGHIESITKTKTKTTILKIADNTSTINVVIFNDANIKHLNQNTNVTITGKVAQYKGQPEIILEDMTNIKINS